MLKFCRFLGGAGERFGKAFDFRRPPVSKVLRYTAPQGGRGFSPIPFRIYNTAVVSFSSVPQAPSGSSRAPLLEPIPVDSKTLISPLENGTTNLVGCLIELIRLKTKPEMRKMTCYRKGYTEQKACCTCVHFL